MNITVVGGGYVGLVTAACFAEMGNAVVCVDRDADKIAGLHQGRLPIYEPGLGRIVRENAGEGRLEFTADIARGIDISEIIFIAVGTPAAADGGADLAQVFSVANEIGGRITEYKVVAIKSTVPVGTAAAVREKITAAIAARKSDAKFSVVSNPEFLKQGAAVEDCMKPDRIIIGAEDARALTLMRKLYAPFHRNHDRIIAMQIASAELTKYAANAMLAARISYMNELANLAEHVGADIESVRLGIGADPRIGYAFIYPGCGYGGSCFPKDVRALHHTAAAAGYDAKLLAAVESVNNAQRNKVVEKALRHFNGDLRGKRIALWGLAFKPNTDDIRDAPSCAVVEALWKQGASVQAFDPVATPRVQQKYGARDDLILFSDDPYAALRDADALIVVTEWRVLRAAEPRLIKQRMRGDVVIDGRNIYDPAAVRATGLIYYGIGRL